MMRRLRSPALFAMLALTAVSTCWAAPDPSDHVGVRTYRYLRRSGAKWAPESEIVWERRKGGSVFVTSTTSRGRQVELKLRSEYDAKWNLRRASVVVRKGEDRQTAEATTAAGKATVARRNKSVERKCPRGVIVTSAPDWTDAFMAARRYDPQGAAEQEFAGLWIHPVKEPLELKIKLIRRGHDFVKLDDERQKLDRLLLVLRGGSRYILWRDQEGKLIRLVPEKSPTAGIVLQGWEDATRELKPPKVEGK